MVRLTDGKLVSSGSRNKLYTAVTTCHTGVSVALDSLPACMLAGCTSGRGLLSVPPALPVSHNLPPLSCDAERGSIALGT